MNQRFEGWEAVAELLRQEAERQQRRTIDTGLARLNDGQQASLRGIAARITANSVVIADEVGMGKTRIAVDVAHAVVRSGGRVAILIPPGLGYQWQAELRDGGRADVPAVLRSLHAYLAAWGATELEKQEPWFNKSIVLVSHVLTNWRLGARTGAWRWAMVPQLYAHWRKNSGDRLPRGYHDNHNLYDSWTRQAAKSITDAVPGERTHPIRRALDKLLEVEWPNTLDSSAYSQTRELRSWLERSVGFGLGVFDLVIIDEAHKNRDVESGLSRLLENVIISSPSARYLALTATPVELDVSQWHSTMRRLRLDGNVLDLIADSCERYAHSVRRIRLAWRSSSEAREDFAKSASHFQTTLSPYLLRRDKREDLSVQQFEKHSGRSRHDYRRLTELTVDTNDLSSEWRAAVCAVESLSVVTRQSTDPIAKRLRLTLGNGHGVAALIDQLNRDEKHDNDHIGQPIQCGSCDEPDGDAIKKSKTISEKKRQDRAGWWIEVLRRPFTSGEDALFEHPALRKAVEFIESRTNESEKVLVFGRFTRPLRALVDLLNAREMLRRLQHNQPWPQAKVHGDKHNHDETSEWPAVRAAHRQLQSPIPIDELDERLRAAYESARRQRDRFREHVIDLTERGLLEIDNPSKAFQAMFYAFKRSVEQKAHGEQSSLTTVSKAVVELLGSVGDEVTAKDCAQAFCELIAAVSDRDKADVQDDEIDEEAASELWQAMEQRLDEEYNRPQGGFARLMFGGTGPESRRIIQLAFNRPQSFPRVLVAQSLVGREGLNLHRSCRIVLMLHPEWNPGVVEQQIGRVDRVDSHWCRSLKKSIDDNASVDQLPRIEICAIVFRGTYDEQNWQVLRSRWDDLRAQLHGIVISSPVADEDIEGQALIREITAAAPSFSPMSCLASR